MGAGEDLTEEGSVGRSHGVVWEEHSGQRERQCKGPEVGARLGHSRNSEEARAAGAEDVKGRGRQR